MTITISASAFYTTLYVIGGLILFAVLVEIVIGGLYSRDAHAYLNKPKRKRNGKRTQTRT